MNSNDFFENLFGALGKPQTVVRGGDGIRMIDIIPLETFDGPLSKRDKIKAFAMLYWPNEGTDDSASTLLFLVPAFELDEAITIVRSAFPIKGREHSDYVLRKWVSKPYDELFPALARPDLNQSSIDKVVVAVMDRLGPVGQGVEPVNIHRSFSDDIARLSAYLVDKFPGELNRDMDPKGESVVDAAIRLLSKIENGQTTKQFAYNLLLVLDRSNPTKTERATVERLLKKFEQKNVQ